MEAHLPEQAVEFQRVASSRAVRSFAHRRLQAWIQGLSAAGVAADAAARARYRVLFQKQGPGHIVLCRVEVKAGRRRWRGVWDAPGLHQALTQCLQHMSPVTAPLETV